MWGTDDAVESAAAARGATAAVAAVLRAPGARRTTPAPPARSAAWHHCDASRRAAHDERRGERVPGTTAASPSRAARRERERSDEHTAMRMRESRSARQQHPQFLAPATHTIGTAHAAIASCRRTPTAATCAPVPRGGRSRSRRRSWRARRQLAAGTGARGRRTHVGASSSAARATTAPPFNVRWSKPQGHERARAHRVQNT